ncbi:MAG: hypothetical protein K1X81_04060 [Bacteroidia bacterium]|nr:hypothetical protein [Bacteroidia bacterium]
MKPSRKCRRKLLFALIALIALSCNYTTNNHEEVKSDSTELDSLRKVECDSLLRYLSKTKSEKINLPDVHPRNISESIIQLDSCTNDTIKKWIKCVTEVEYISALHFSFGMHLRNNWGLWAESDLSKYFNSLGIYHPDDMSSIILKCFHQFVNTGTYSFKEKVNYYKEYWTKLKQREDRTNQINALKHKETKRFVDSLNELIHYKQKLQSIKGLVNDSLNFYIELLNGDTIFIWTTCSMTRLTKEEYVNLTKDKSFGENRFLGQISDDGSIYDLTLCSKRFIRNNGNLFYEEENGEFVKIFSLEMARNPYLVNKWPAVNNCSFNKSFIKTKWRLKGKNYFYVEINGDCRGSKLEVRYFIDENLKVICDERIIRELWACKKLIDK